MAVEAPGPISALNPNWPLDGDERREGAEHIRVVKGSLQIQFPNLNAVTPRTPDEVNALTGASEATPLQAQITALVDTLGALEQAAVGDLRLSGADTPPTDWLLCAGTEVSRTTESELFAVIGTAYGEGDGSTTFNLPDFRHRAPIGVGFLDGGANGVTRGEKGGARDVTLTGAQSGVPAHTHPSGEGSNKYFGTPSSPQGLPSTGGAAGLKSFSGTGSNSPANAAEAHDNMSPYTVVNVFIKARATSPAAFYADRLLQLV